MQRAYINALSSLAEKDKRVVSVLADNGTDYDWLFERDFPDRFFNVGIAEQNMVAMGAGLASCGYIPFVLTAGSFLIYRAYEFIRNDICFANKNVKLIGSGSGLSISNLGPTHHTTEDLSLLRSLPNLKVFTPSSPSEVTQAVQEAYLASGPVYIRLGMSGEAEVFNETDKSLFGKARVIKQGNDVYLLSSGSIISEALKAADELEGAGVSVGIVSFSVIKPFDADIIEDIFNKAKLLVSIEDHSVIGGLGSAVAEILSSKKEHAPLLRIGIEDCFASGYGTQNQIRKINNIDSSAIVKRIRNYLEK